MINKRREKITAQVNKSDYYTHYQTVCAYCGQKFDDKRLPNVDAHHRFTALCEECYYDPANAASGVCGIEKLQSKQQETKMSSTQQEFVRNTGTIERTEQKQEKTRDELAPVNAYNRDVLFTALSAAGIGRVIVEFDGDTTDEDWNIHAYKKEGLDQDEMEISTTPKLTIQVIEEWNEESYQIEEQTETLAEAIRLICRGFLEQTHGQQWSYGAGSWGTFLFDPIKKIIKLEYNDRVEVCSEHEF